MNNDNIMTITTADLVLPGDVLGGAMLRGSDPIRGQVHIEDRRWCECVHVLGGWFGMDAAMFSEDLPGPITGRASRLHCVNRGTRDRAYRVLARGEECSSRLHSVCGAPTVDGLGCDQMPPCAGPHKAGNTRQRCHHCNGTGFTRPPHDLSSIQTADTQGRISESGAAALVWCSVLRVESGMGPVRAPLPMGDLGDAYQTALDLGIPLLDGDSVLLPHPEGPRRLLLGKEEA